MYVLRIHLLIYTIHICRMQVLDFDCMKLYLSFNMYMKTGKRYFRNMNSDNFNLNG